MSNRVPADLPPAPAEGHATALVPVSRDASSLAVRPEAALALATHTLALATRELEAKRERERERPSMPGTWRSKNPATISVPRSPVSWKRSLRALARFA